MLSQEQLAEGEAKLPEESKGVLRKLHAELQAPEIPSPVKEKSEREQFHDASKDALIIFKNAKL